MYYWKSKERKFNVMLLDFLVGTKIAASLALHLENRQSTYGCGLRACRVISVPAVS
jgi:hypothetical protein